MCLLFGLTYGKMDALKALQDAIKKHSVYDVYRHKYDFPPIIHNMSWDMFNSVHMNIKPTIPATIAQKNDILQ